MRVREIIVRKGIGGYHATAVTDENVTVDLPGGGSEGGRKRISVHSGSMATVLADLRHRMRKARADFRRATVRSEVPGIDGAGIRRLLGESDDAWKHRVAAKDPDFARRMGLADKEEEVAESATFEDFMALFEPGA